MEKLEQLQIYDQWIVGEMDRWAQHFETRGRNGAPCSWTDESRWASVASYDTDQMDRNGRDHHQLLFQELSNVGITWYNNTKPSPKSP